MASILRQIVSGPRARHPEAGLDLCYVTENIVVTSGPSSVWPKKAYRNPVDHLVAFLDSKHGEEWAIFEFRAEGTGYPDAEVYNRVHHFPWPDHHPPPFAIIPNLMAAMRNWLQGESKSPDKHRVAVVHCKAGKGRSGTASCSYLISQEGWTREDALKRFTLRRMRAGFGQGVSIPSQLRWVDYVDRWTNRMEKTYVERPVQIVELHVWGLRGGVKVGVEGFIEDGRRIKNFHTFTRHEKTNVDKAFNHILPNHDPASRAHTETLIPPTASTSDLSHDEASTSTSETSQNVILRPSTPIQLETSDVNIDFERRNKSTYTGFTVVTSIAHVWFNAFFEGGFDGRSSGIFEIEWDAMDGIKGSARKGIKALDRLQVVWKYADDGQSQIVDEPQVGEPVKEGHPSDWHETGHPEKDIEAKHSGGISSGRVGGAKLTLSEMTHEAANMLVGKDLGLRETNAESANISRASSLREDGTRNPHDSKPADVKEADGESELEGTKSHVLDDGHSHTNNIASHESHEDDRQDTATGKYLELGMSKVANIISKLAPGDHK